MSDLNLKVNDYYFNKLGDLVLIVGEVQPDHKAYKKGFRFVDHRGSYYCEKGSVKSKVFHALDLAHEAVIGVVESVKLQKLEREMKNFMRKHFIIPITKRLFWQTVKIVIVTELVLITAILIDRGIQKIRS